MRWKNRFMYSNFVGTSHVWSINHVTSSNVIWVTMRIYQVGNKDFITHSLVDFHIVLYQDKIISWSYKSNLEYKKWWLSNLVMWVEFYANVFFKHYIFWTSCNIRKDYHSWLVPKQYLIFPIISSLCGCVLLWP